MKCYCTKSGLKNCGCISKCIFWCMFLLRIARYKIGFLFKCSEMTNYSSVCPHQQAYRQNCSTA